MLAARARDTGTGDAAAVATDDEVTVDAERFDSSARARLVGSFARLWGAIVATRHTSAEAMHADWLACFATGAARNGRNGRAPARDVAESGTHCSGSSIESLPLSISARNALDRSGVVTVRDLLQVPMNELSAIRRVGRETVREILEVVRAIARPTRNRRC